MKIDLFSFDFIANLGRLIEQTPKLPILLEPAPKLLKYSESLSDLNLQQEDRVEVLPQ
jgi:hypothetical protein